MAATRAFDLDFRVRTARLPDDVFLAAVAGELDLHTAPQLETALAARSAGRLIVDLTGVTFLDSTALWLLAAQARSGDGRLALVCDVPGTLRTLEVNGVAPLFVLHRTLREALESTH